MNSTKVLLLVCNAAVAVNLAACASSPRVVSREQNNYDEMQIVSRGSAPTSDEDLRALRDGRERQTAASSSSTSVNRSGKVKAQSSETEVVDTITETVVEMVPVASGDESLR